MIQFLLEPNYTALEELNASDITPLQKITSFLLAHKIKTQSTGGSGEGHNFDFVERHGDRPSITHVLHIPENKVDRMFELFCECDEGSRPNLSERVTRSRFVHMFFDIDWSITKMRAKNFTLKGQDALNYFDSRLETLINQIKAVARIPAFGISDDDMCEIVVAKRCCYKYHIYFPKVSLSVEKMRSFRRELVKDLSTDSFAEPYFKWDTVIDANVYTGALRVPGATKELTEAMLTDLEAHNQVFTVSSNCLVNGAYHLSLRNFDDYRIYYSLASNEPITPEIMRLSRLSSTQASQEEVDPVDHIKNAISKYTSPRIKTIIESAVHSFNTIPDFGGYALNPGIHSFVRKIDRDGKDYWGVTLVKQQCPFVRRFHNRTLAHDTPTVCCQIYRNKVTLTCFACLPRNPDTRRSVPCDNVEDMEYAEFNEVVMKAIIYGDDNCLRNMIVHTVKDRIAASCVNEGSKGHKKQYEFYAFMPTERVWIDGSYQLMKDVANDDGVLQTKISEMAYSILPKMSSEAQALFKKSKSKLIRTLASAPTLVRLRDTIAQTLSEIWRNRDPQKRLFHNVLNERGDLLNFRNGIIDCSNGRAVFRNTRPDDYVTMTTRNNYRDWDAEVSADDKKRITDLFLLMWPVFEERRFCEMIFGRMINGERRRTKITFFFGHGADGKSTFVTYLNAAFGDYAKQGEPKMLFGLDNNSSSGAREEVLLLKHARVGFMSEAETENKMNMPMSKRVSSIDLIPVRGLYAKHENLALKCQLFVTHNDEVNIKTTVENRGNLRRLERIYFRRRFFESEEAVQATRATFPETMEEFRYLAVGVPEDQLTRQKDKVGELLISYLVFLYNKHVEMENFDAYEPQCSIDFRNQITTVNDTCGEFVRLLLDLAPADSEVDGIDNTDLWTTYTEYIRNTKNSNNTIKNQHELVRKIIFAFEGRVQRGRLANGFEGLLGVRYKKRYDPYQKAYLEI